MTRHVPWPGIRRAVLLCLASIAAAAPPGALAQVWRAELIPFPTASPSDAEFLAGVRGAKPATIAGELRIPTPGTDRLATVVLIHGSGGLGGYVEDWVPLLNGMGLATFVVDSFSGRGIANVQADQSQLGRLAGVVDAYRALELLARHPRVDPSRIAVMGFSRGGQAALYASVKRFQRLQGPEGAAFAAYVAFYPDCVTTFVGDGDVSERPIRILHGTADDYAPIGACRAYAGRLRAAGKDVVLTELEGAAHVFDWAMLEKPMKLPQAQTVRRCQLREAPEGRIVNVATGQPFTYADPCVERGTTLAYDARARREAEKVVREVMAGLVGRK